MGKIPRAVASDTRTWSSGSVRFVVITVEGHPDETYIKFEKNLMGRPADQGGAQRFNLRLRDWGNLKRLVEHDLADRHQWVLDDAGVEIVPTDKAGLLSFIEAHPILIEKVLDLDALGFL